MTRKEQASIAESIAAARSEQGYRPDEPWGLTISENIADVMFGPGEGAKRLEWLVSCGFDRESLVRSWDAA